MYLILNKVIIKIIVILSEHTVLIEVKLLHKYLELLRYEQFLYLLLLVDVFLVVLFGR